MSIKLEPAYDVLVIGAGITGLVAALSARENGARIALLEKAADCRDNNTSRAGGSLSFASEREEREKRRFSVEEKVAEAIHYTNGLCDVSLINNFVTKVDETLEWLEKLGFQWDSREQSPFAKRALGGGANICPQLLTMAEKMGCKIFFNTKVIDILKKDNGEILGVKASTGVEAKEFTAKAVVLATGGFQANPEMRAKYLGPEWESGINLAGTPLGQGEGHLMASRTGAQLVTMDNFHSSALYTPKDPKIPARDPLRQLRLTSRMGIIVNKRGRRFIDEGSTINAIGASIRKQPDGQAAIIWDEGIKQEITLRIKRDETEEYSRMLPGLITKLISLEEVSQFLGGPLEELRKTVDTYNRAVEKGEGKELDVPRLSPGLTLKSPFYILYPVKAALNSTLGGLRITPQAEVIDQNGRVIPGLFAAGTVTGAFFCGQYLSNKDGSIYYQGNLQVTASSLAYCAVFGRIAGGEAACYEKSGSNGDSC